MITQYTKIFSNTLTYVCIIVYHIFNYYQKLLNFYVQFVEIIIIKFLYSKKKSLRLLNRNFNRLIKFI